MIGREVVDLGSAFAAHLRRFRPCFRQDRTAGHLGTDRPRPSAEPIAPAAGTAARALPLLRTTARWDHAAARAALHRHRAAAAAATPADPLGTAGVVDGTNCRRSGGHTLGVPRHYLGRVGEPGRGIVTARAAVTRVTFQTPAAAQHRPKARGADRGRCRAAGILNGVRCAEAARGQPDGPVHDADTRLLHRLEPEPAERWAEVAPFVDRGAGVLVVDDTTHGKPHARRIELVTCYGSGKHRAVVNGINLLTLVWADGTRAYPTDYRVYQKAADERAQNDHFRELVATAHERGGRPRYVRFDEWCTGLDNLKRVRSLGWLFLGRLKTDRLVRVDRGPRTGSASGRSRRWGRWSGCRGTGC